jgi:SpoVK/Ycf46/Vps4 family AAA+-type ATPase
VNSRKIDKIGKSINELDQKSFVLLMEILDGVLDKDELKLLKEIRASKNLKPIAMANLVDVRRSNNQYIYQKELDKLNFIINDNEIMDEINGLKVIISGPTGTGKTTFVNKLIANNPNIKNIVLEFSTLLSPKLGQTQLNLVALSDKIVSEDNKVFLFIDELDSIVNDRAANDVAEHKRIVGSFIRFIDSLPNNVILIAATNFLEHVDTAIVRRFNFKFETREFDLNVLLIELESCGFTLENEEVNKIEMSLTNKKFAYSDILNFKFNFLIDKKMNNLVDNFKFFVDFFKEKLDVKGLIK